MIESLANKEIARLLKEISAAYEAKNENRFKIIAYDHAASAIEHATSEIKDLYDEGKLDTLPGVGEGITEHLTELFEKGKVAHFEQIKKGLPAGMFDILGIPGIGPKTAFTLAKNFHIASIEDLKKLCQSHQVQKLAGFGEKTEKDLLRGISEFEQRSDRMLLPVAFALAEEVLNELRKNPATIRADPLGSLRRMVSTIGDIDIAVSSKNPQKIIEQFTNLKNVKRILNSGERKATVLLKNGRQVDLMVQPPECYGSLLQHFTGSKHHNIHLRKVANELGLSLSEYGIKKISNQQSAVSNQLHPKGHQFSEDTLFPCKTEEEFYQMLNMQYVPPELREDTGEIEAARKHKLPNLIELTDIKGEFHVHSNYPIEPSHDPGSNEMEEIIEKAKSLGYEFIGLADHSPAVTTHTPEQIKTLVNARTKKIENLKSSTSSIPIVNSLEVDILADGRISLPDDLLKTLDVTIVGIHSSHRQSKEIMTERILGALQNPYVHILAHPTNRLLLEREACEADWEKIFAFCAENHKALEINGFPNRLDLPDFMIKEAKSHGVKFMISTDSHEVSQMENMRFGVATARRAWAEKDDILNTWPLDKILKYLLK